MTDQPNLNPANQAPEIRQISDRFAFYFNLVYCTCFCLVCANFLVALGIWLYRSYG